jgi:hypothetical protein
MPEAGDLLTRLERVVEAARTVVGVDGTGFTLVHEDGLPRWVAAADARERAADVRERAADHRDRDAEARDRDRAADQRERDAEARDRADQRDRAADDPSSRGRPARPGSTRAAFGDIYSGPCAAERWLGGSGGTGHDGPTDSQIGLRCPDR